jgi:hypothetical protein
MIISFVFGGVLYLFPVADIPDHLSEFFVLCDLSEALPGPDKRAMNTHSHICIAKLGPAALLKV